MGGLSPKPWVKVHMESKYISFTYICTFIPVLSYLIFTFKSFSMSCSCSAHEEIKFSLLCDFSPLGVI